MRSNSGHVKLFPNTSMTSLGTFNSPSMMVQKFILRPMMARSATSHLISDFQDPDILPSRSLLSL